MYLSNPSLTSSSLEGAPLPEGSAHPTGACPVLPPLTCAPAGPIKEFPWPPFSVIQVSQDVGTTPGPGVSGHLSTLAPALLRATDIGRLRSQRRAALLGQQAVHGHADPGELRPGSRQDSTGQATEHQPPPKGAHGFMIRRTLSGSPLLVFRLPSSLSFTLEFLSIHLVFNLGSGIFFLLIYFCFAFYSSPY